MLYRTPQELFELIDSYLAHEDERQAIAQRGQAQVRQAHTYRHRLQQILALVDERCGRSPNTAQEQSPCASS